MREAEQREVWEQSNQTFFQKRRVSFPLIFFSNIARSILEIQTPQRKYLIPNHHEATYSHSICRIYPHRPSCIYLSPPRQSAMKQQHDTSYIETDLLQIFSLLFLLRTNLLNASRCEHIFFFVLLFFSFFLFFPDETQKHG